MNVAGAGLGKKMIEVNFGQKVMSASSGVWKPELKTDWGAQDLVGTA